MNFYKICQRAIKKNLVEVYPTFVVGRPDNLMTRGKDFYAIYNETTGFWSTDESDVADIVDAALWNYAKTLDTDSKVRVLTLSDFSTGMWTAYKAYVSKMPQNYFLLDSHLTFLSDNIKREDYVTKRLPYDLKSGDISAYDSMMRVLYSPAEREKLEWAIGSIVSGDSKKIQKFVVLYGDPGTGKSTVLNIIEMLFEGYTTAFESKSLGSSRSSFAMEMFRGNPLIAIEHDGDLSGIEDNTRFNSLVSHETIIINEKFKSGYPARINAMLFIGTNKPVKITDSKSGIIRRLIDVNPTGKRLNRTDYDAYMSQIKFELGAIASHCLNVYKSLGKKYYDGYVPIDMLFKTDVFFNFIEDNYDIFTSQDGVTLQQAYDLYKSYCEETRLHFTLPRYKFREELKNYFSEFIDRAQIDGERKRSYYKGFLTSKFEQKQSEADTQMLLDFKSTNSMFDEMAALYSAQYANDDGYPYKKWENVETRLEDLDTTRLHYVKVPENHIVIDFDLRDSTDKKSARLNLEKASEFPPTYGEFSKSGEGVHLHYIYDGDVDELSSVYCEGVEIKKFKGNSSLRRKLSFCNSLPIATISSGLPRKEQKMVNMDVVLSEQSIRTMIIKNLNKEYHAYTTPSVQYIKKILDDAYSSGVVYDVSDLKQRVLTFANNSTHQAQKCLKLVAEMKFKSEVEAEDISCPEEAPIMFFDVEVFPNLFVMVVKKQGEDVFHKLVNPSPQEVESFFKFKLVGFNNRRYDNHIIFARYLGYSNEQLFNLSRRIVVEHSNDCMFREAYNLSYTDIYDFSSKKQSLKKFEIELGIHHQEIEIPWDQPVPDNLIDTVVEYCNNDVIATEAVFNARKSDYEARLILSDISGLTPNNTTQQHTARIIFGKDKNPQAHFVYTDLSKEFPGYKFEFGKSSYLDVEEVGEGGYVYSEPGVYVNVALLDIASMHPTSIEVLNVFGKYTKNFSAIKAARIAVKHRDFDTLKTIFGGEFMRFCTSDEEMDKLAYSLKIAINIVYGMTSAKFDNPFRDPRNVDNIVAKRGALFMIKLRNELQSMGVTVAHVKTDSVKIPNATPEIIQFVMDYGRKYGYEFEHEATYSRMALVNNAVYIAQYADGKHAGEWTATGAQFAHPYVFKTLFSHEKIDFEDLCEAKAVQSGAMYLVDDNGEKFVGKVGLFCPMKEDKCTTELRVKRDDKLAYVAGAKGYHWMEAETVKELKLERYIDLSYFDKLVDDAVDNINKVGDYSIMSN